MKTDFKVYSDVAYDMVENKYVIRVSVVLGGEQKSAAMSISEGGHIHPADIGALLAALGRSLAYFQPSSNAS